MKIREYLSSSTTRIISQTAMTKGYNSFQLLPLPPLLPLLYCSTNSIKYHHPRRLIDDNFKGIFVALIIAQN